MNRKAILSRAVSAIRFDVVSTSALGILAGTALMPATVRGRRTAMFLAMAAGASLQWANRAAAQNWAVGSGNWSIASNWDSDAVPANGATANIVESDNVARTITYDYPGPAVALGTLTIDLQGGSNVDTLSIAANNLTANDESIGNGAVNQTGGTNTSQVFDLGNQGDTASYTLAGSATLSVGRGEIYGTGSTFNQTGGTSTIQQLSFISGNYILAGGVLTVSTVEEIGGSGDVEFSVAAIFSQTNGTNSANLYVGFDDGAGTYTLSGGILSSPYEEIGSQGSTGTFSQTGGTNTVAELVVDGTGSYALGGGSLAAGSLNLASGALSWTAGTLNLTDSSLTVGSGGTLGSSLTLASGQTLDISGSGQSLGVTGTMNVNGGGLSVPTIAQTAGAFTDTGTLALAGAGGNAITYNLSGGTMNVGAISVGSGGALNWTAGTLQLTGSNIEIGGSGLFGSSLSLSSSKTLVAGFGVSIDPGSTLNLQGGGLTVNTGATLNNGGTFSQTSGLLTVNGAFINSGTATFGATPSWGPASVFVNLAGTATFDNAINPGGIGPVIVITGGNVVYESGGSSLPTTLKGLSIAALGTLDLTNSHLFIQYVSGADPIASIASLIKSGFAGGAWNGPGIMSTNAQSNSLSYGIGYSDSADPGNPAGLASGQIEIMYTLLGDANLDGKVNGTDFNILAANFNTGGDSWDQGDFTYDGKVNGSDFNLLAENFNQGATQAADFAALDSFAAANGLSLSADVPEPGVVSLLLPVSYCLLGKRRRALRERVESRS